MSVISLGYRAPEQSAVSNAVVASSGVAEDNLAVSDVVATEIAASVAQAASLAVAPNIAERAVSTRVQSAYQAAGSGSSVISKPAIVEMSEATRNITTYTVVEGDTVDSIAAKFNISAQTVKWANNLTGNSVAVGSTVDILPSNGIAYVVKDGDTIEKIAEKYKADAAYIVSHNDLELDGIRTGLKIIIPGGELPETERPGYVAPAPVYSSYRTGFVTGVGAWSGSVLGMGYFRPGGFDAGSGGYAPGNCTAYAYYRRAQLGRPIPSQLGNAYTWATQARAFNFTVNKTPAAGAVIQSGNHVGVVEEVLPNGDIRITDMNYGYRLYNLADRIIPASTVHNYMFIH